MLTSFWDTNQYDLMYLNILTEDNYMSNRRYVDYKPTIYEYDRTNNLRFVLGNYGKKTLVCVGINPNTADADTSDNTMNDLIKFSRQQGYDGCIMINPYPLICNSPSKLPIEFDRKICEANLKYISSVFEHCKGGDLLLSWGDYILKNHDFKEQVAIILNKAKEKKMRLIHINSLTKGGNPRHFRNLCRDKEYNAGKYNVNVIKY